MIKSCVLWQGAYYATYQDEVREWQERVCEDPNSFLRFDLREIDEKDKLSVLEIVPEESSFLFDEQTILIDYLQSWTSPSVQKLLKAIQSHECNYNVALIQREKEPFKAVLSTLTEDVYNRRIPYDPDGMAQWTQDWLSKYHVTIKSDVATRLAEYVGEDLDSLISCVTAIAYGGETKQVGWSDLQKHLEGEGIIPIFRLTSEIAKGDKNEALHVLRRVLSELHPLQILKLLENKFRSYVQIANLSDAAAREFLGGRGAYYTVKEANDLGSKRIKKCWLRVSEAAGDMKGGSIMDPEDVLIILVTRLTQEFYLSHKRR